MLDINEFVPHAPAESGGQTKVHHCKQGKDNDRLYIRRCEDGITILAYCHHCGERGWFRETGGRSMANLKAHRSRRDESKLEQRNLQGRYDVPRDADSKIENWPARARLWLRTYGITDDEIHNYGITYSPFHNRVVLPVYRDGALALFQTRKIDPKDNMPKYLTYANRRVGFWARYAGATGTLVITEDVLSAIRCARHVDALALLGTHLATEDLFKILKDRDQKYRKVLIFLDNDNRQVRNSQLKLKETLGMYFDVTILKMDKDPKEFSDADLKDILTGGNNACN